jgi:uncharacterized membrane protein
MPMYYYPGMSGASMTFWMIVATLFWVAVATLIVWALVRLMTRNTGTSYPKGQQTATDILKARYAHGEIDGATFHAMMEQLTAADKMATTVKSN